MKLLQTLKSAIRCALVLLAGLLLCSYAAMAQNLPPTWVFARAYAGWNIIGQQANTYTFNGGACNYTPYNNGNSPGFFVFSGLQNTTTVYNPVAILDANPTLSEIATPTSTVQSTATCGFAASTTNQHTSFTLVSGTAGLQEAITNQLQAAPPSSVLLDNFWYQLVFGLPGLPTPESLIKAAKGSSNVTIVDTTTSPWTYWRWSGTAYAVAGIPTGGTAAPTAAAGAAAGTSPTGPTNTGDGNTFTVALTTGTATTTGTLFTETWATTAAFLYPPSCRVISTGANVLPFTYAVSFTASAAKVTVTSVTAPVASTAYALQVVCN